MPFHGRLGHAPWQRRPNTFQIITVAPLSYLFITDRDIESKKGTVSDMQNVMTVSQHTHCR